MNRTTPIDRKDLLRRLWQHLLPRRRHQFVLLFFLMLLSTAAEVVSLGAVVPFLAVLTAPDSIFKYAAAARIATALGATTGADLVLPLTIAFAGIALVAGAVRMLLLWATTRLAFATGADLGAEVYRRTLYQPYPVHVARSSSEVIAGISRKVDGVVFYVIQPALTLVSSAVLLVATTLVLIAIDPTVALIAICAFGSSYALIAWASRRSLNRSSARIAAEQTQVLKALQEGLGGIRDVLLDGTQPLYCDIYRRADRPLRRAQGYVVFNSTSPRFVMEALGMVLIAALAYGLSRQVGGIAAALPVLGALALGAQRMLPALQQGYAAWANIAGSEGTLADVVRLLDQPVPEEMVPVPPALPFRQAVQLIAVRFRYADDGPWILDDFNLTLPKGGRVALVGSTGSGKSTALDIVMGLLHPTEGRVLVDGLPLNGERLRAWQQAIAHVSQTVFLADATIAENIAFGVPREAIDLSRVREAASRARLAEFIEGRPERYDAFVGERGVRLSGGQRQRIGIARALYKRAHILIFDEATSALDNITEQSVMDAIQELDRDMTILLIAHRHATVRRCETIVEVEGGRVVAQGTYQSMLERSSSFRQMAAAAG